MANMLLLHLLILTAITFTNIEAVPGEKSSQYCDETHKIKTGREKRIVGGIDALSKEFPHMVLLGYVEGENIAWMYAGNLINSKYVLTAASCILVKQPKYVKLGDLYREGESKHAKVVKISNSLRHPHFSSESLYHNLGLIRLAEPAEFTDYIKPACLHVGSNRSADNSYIVTGWGLTSYLGDPNSRLQKIGMREISNADCRVTYGISPRLDKGIMDESQICASGFEKNTCRGDSGGALQKLNPKHVSTWDLYGITSLGKRCESNEPGVYSRISYYLDWIESVAFNDE